MPEIIIQKDVSEAGLAVMLSDLIKQNLEKDPKKIKSFDSLDANILIEAHDIQVSVGLEFREGRMTVSEQPSATPDLHIIADSMTVLQLSLMRIKFGLPYFFDRSGFEILKKLASGKLLIKGMIRNFGILVKLTKIVSIA